MFKKIINKILGRETVLDGLDNMKQWKSAVCWDCGAPINPKSCWQRFQEINGEVCRVNICDDCSNKI